MVHAQAGRCIFSPANPERTPYVYNGLFLKEISGLMFLFPF